MQQLAVNVYTVGFIQCHTLGQINQEYKETSRIKCVSHIEKLTRKRKIFGSVMYLILGFAKHKIQQKNNKEKNNNYSEIL